AVWPASRSLNVRRRKALQLAPQLLAELLDVLGRELGVRFGGLHQGSRQRLARRAQVLLGPCPVAGAAQGERLLLGVLGVGGDALSVGRRQKPPASIQRPRDAHADGARRGASDHELGRAHPPVIVAPGVDGTTSLRSRWQPSAPMRLETLPAWAGELLQTERVARLAYVD